MDEVQHNSRNYGSCVVCAPLDMSTHILVNMSATIYRSRCVGQHIGRQISLNVGRDSGRYVGRESVNISTDTRPICRSRYWPICRSICRSTCRPTHLDRHIGRESVDMSTNISVEHRSICPLTCRPTYRLTVSRHIDRCSTNMSVDISTYSRPMCRSRCVGRGVHKLHMIQNYQGQSFVLFAKADG